MSALRKIPHGQNEARVAYVMKQHGLNRNSPYEKREEVVEIARKHLPGAKPQKVRNLISKFLVDPRRATRKAKIADINDSQ
jgi:hypothetical protein